MDKILVMVVLAVICFGIILPVLLISPKIGNLAKDLKDYDEAKKRWSERERQERYDRAYKELQVKYNLPTKENRR
jgi:hypothetical protein